MYAIYYKVAGDARHLDSQAQAVTSAIAEKAHPAPTGPASADGSGLAKTGDAAPCAVSAASALAALAAAALALAHPACASACVRLLLWRAESSRHAVVRVL